MPIHDHGPAATSPLQSPETSARNARFGLVLFAVYLTLYSGFVAINAFAPQITERMTAGVNLAIWYGFGLIAAAFILALVYGWLCRASASDGEGRPR